MGITLDQLVFDATNPDDGANVGAYLRAGDDGTAIGHVGDALKVDIGNTTDLDIRDLTDGSGNTGFDQVRLGDGTNTLSVTAAGALVVEDGGGSLTVDATQLDIDDLNATDDAVQAWLRDGAGNSISSTDVGGKQSLDVNVTSGINVEVDLSHVDDSVRLGDGTTLTNVTADGRLEIFASPDVSAQNSTATVGLTAVELAATPLANRKKILIQNRGNKSIFIGGSSGVTTANGIEIPGGASYSEDWGENVDIFAISGTAGQDVRIMEVS